MSGKGSTRRPTNEEAFQANYDAIFGKNRPVFQPVVKVTKDELRELYGCVNPDTCSEPFCNCEVSPCNPQK